MSAVLLIDGRSGSGKTVLAERIVAGAEDPVFAGAQILHLDDLYPGWDGLAAGSRAVATALSEGGYRRYIWEMVRFAEWVPLDPSLPLVVEGCGSVTRENLAAAKHWAERGTVRSVWLECAEEVRRRRALDRDGEMFAPHWDRWAEQELAHYAVEHPLELVDEIVAME